MVGKQMSAQISSASIVTKCYDMMFWVSTMNLPVAGLISQIRKQNYRTHSHSIQTRLSFSCLKNLQTSLAPPLGLGLAPRALL